MHGAEVSTGGYFSRAQRTDDKGQSIPYAARVLGGFVAVNRHEPVDNGQDPLAANVDTSEAVNARL
jgi:hypothetical protein